MTPLDPQRRLWLTRTAQAVGVAACGGLIWNAFLVRSVKAAPWAPRPPGARAGSDFEASCIKCGVCLEACPYGTLKLATVGDGPALGTPYFEPRVVPCYMCPDVPCAKSCPTGALDREIKSINDARMGLAVIDPETCLSWQGLRCEICYRVCPVRDQAISVQPHPRQISKHAIFVPVVHANACTGCGLCTNACPTEIASINVVNPAKVRGKMGEHYRLSTPDAQPTPLASPAELPADLPTESPTTAPAASPTPPTAAPPTAVPAPAAPASAPAAKPTVPGLDYLNGPP